MHPHPPMASSFPFRAIKLKAITFPRYRKMKNIFFSALIALVFVLATAFAGKEGDFSLCSTTMGEGVCMSSSDCSSKGGFGVAANCTTSSVTTGDMRCCLNEKPVLGYNADAAVSWGNSNCGVHSEWLCAEFVSRALHAGGEFPGVSDYGNYNGYNLRLVSDLHRYLKNNGWSESSQGTWCGSAGQVLIYNINGDPNAHAALAIGNCKLDQHNPSRCGTSSNWGPNIVLKKV